MDSMGIPLAFQGNIIVKKNTNLKDQTPYSTTDDISITLYILSFLCHAQIKHQQTPIVNWLSSTIPNLSLQTTTTAVRTLSSTATTAPAINSPQPP
ncbi:hypothetical protein K443DRAFT_16024 [Laccaria amethystina LaAM-08-1]|uniref:Uncharacterized protein n=1 Tax=Laccaria amethystina LaAM-08-1 TaxID=1095629 RepID=A0A0C9WGI9_9AGAR|nr:hypothetical protein K443DRAFT_16024 [Laccaria amethystina LaAM-08-1]